jgi:hypothetical protein
MRSKRASDWRPTFIGPVSSPEPNVGPAPMRRLILLAVTALVLWSMGPSRTALAHEIVVIGPYWLNIGWQSEPPLVGEKNAVLIIAANAETSAMVESLATIRISISTGGRSQELVFVPVAEDTPGQFVADVIPTVRGVYTLELRGTLGDERVSADVDLDEVEDAGSLQFPERTSSVLELERRLAAAESALGQSRLVAIVAIVISGLNLLASAVWIVARTRSKRS